MRLLYWGPDGGPESTSYGFFLIELKKLFSIVLLRFDDKSREAFHSHAFNSVSWLLSGQLTENFIDGKGHQLNPSLKPILTRRSTFHKVDSTGRSWVLSFRGPWAPIWLEYLEEGKRWRVLTHGRKEVV